MSAITHVCVVTYVSTPMEATTVTVSWDTLWTLMEYPAEASPSHSIQTIVLLHTITTERSI